MAFLIKKIIEKLDVIENHSNIVKKAQENKVQEFKKDDPIIVAQQTDVTAVQR